jgi:hypothetical protein
MAIQKRRDFNKVMGVEWPLGTKKRGFEGFLEARNTFFGLLFRFLGHKYPKEQPIAAQMSYPQNTRS